MGITYEVAVDYKVTGDLSSRVPQLTAGTERLGVSIDRGRLGAQSLGRELGSLERAAGDFGRAFVSAGSAVSGAFTDAVERVGSFARTAAMAAGAAGIGAIAYGVAELNSELESTQIGLADILTRNGVTSNLTEGLSKASGLMEKIREDAEALPGTSRELSGIFSMAAIPGLRSGAGTDRVEKLSANAMAFGVGPAHLPAEQVGRELSMLLSGRAGAHNVLGMQLAGLGGAQAQSFNAMSDAQRFSFLEKEFAKSEETIKAYQHSWQGLSSAVKDYGERVLGVATKPLEERIKGTLEDISDWYHQNRDRIFAFATDLGEKLADAWSWGLRKFQEWAPAIRTFAQDAYAELRSIWTQIEPVVSRVAETVRTSLGDGTALRELKSVLTLYADAKFAGAAAPLVGGAFNAFGGARGLFAGAGAAGGGAAAGEGLGLGALGGPAAIAAAIGALAAGGEAMGLANGRADAIQAAGELGQSLRSLKDDVVGGQTGLSQFLEKLGSEGTSELAKFFEGLHGILDFGGTMREITQYRDDAQASLDDIILKNPSDPQYGAAHDRRARRQFRASWAGDTFSPGRDMDLFTPATGSSLLDGAAIAALEKAEKKNKDKGPPQIHIGKVEITVSSNQDPSRIAQETFGLLANMRRHPTVSRSARNWTSVTGG